MNIKIKQEGLKDILNFLQLGGVFPYVSFSVKQKTTKSKDPYIESIQQTPDCTILRIVKFNKKCFDSIDPTEETVKFDGVRLHKLISREDPKTELSITKDDEFLIVTSPTRIMKVSLLEKIDVVLESLPFNLPKGIPTFPNMDNVQIENLLVMGMKSFRTMVEDAKTLSTEYFNFIQNDKQELTIEVGDIEARSDKVIHHPIVDVKEFLQPVDLTLTTGLKECATVFGSSVNIRLKTDFPMWLTEEDDKHKLGVMIAPKAEQEES